MCGGGLFVKCVDDLFSGNDISLLVAAAASPGPVTVSVCSSNYAGDCCGVFTNTIQVKFCPGTGGDSDYYVYQLKNVPICDMAYCAVKGMEAAPPSRKHSSALLWSRYGIGHAVMLSFVMVALCNRADHYIFAL